MPTSVPRWLLAVSLLGVLAPAAAQYKIVGPDGRVTYSDRPPAETVGKISSIGRSGVATAAADAALPFELRQVVARYPVTLYGGENCAPCDSARQLLQQRGVPYVERQILSDEDQQALERLVGGRSIPAVSIGAQPLRGLNVADWNGFLDAAGYPRESKLPRNWQPPAATPLVERTTLRTTPRTAAAPAPSQTARTTTPPPLPDAPEDAPASTIRF